MRTYAAADKLFLRYHPQSEERHIRLVTALSFSSDSTKHHLETAYSHQSFADLPPPGEGCDALGFCCICPDTKKLNWNCVVCEVKAFSTKE